MAYDKNRGRAAGTPSFYKTVGQKHTHGENTGERTREQRARHEDGDFKPRAPKGGERFDAPKDFKRARIRRPARPPIAVAADHRARAAYRRAAPATVLEARICPVYQDAFEGAPGNPSAAPRPARAQSDTRRAPPRAAARAALRRNPRRAPRPRAALRRTVARLRCASRTLKNAAPRRCASRTLKNVARLRCASRTLKNAARLRCASRASTSIAPRRCPRRALTSAVPRPCRRCPRRRIPS